MTVKLTQTRLDNLIDTLNALICDEEWAKKWKPVAKELREKYSIQHAETQSENS
ncbi:hypothetical protein ACQEMD_004645 [Salmonella enterica]|nr:hypothetical protein [Salmonella enterica subsp. enterica]EEJ6415316.1 hypothetical protein [Salmonella enterica subsp. enterica]EGS2971928.1 hypothetical protein [Salmonella enterica]EHZ0473899.1 hypothetical protein [Salmonella enterica subsp. enterica serovar Brunei]